MESEYNILQIIITYLWNIICVDAVYRVSDILSCGNDEREGEHASGSDAVVKPEDPAVDVDVRHVQEPLKLSEYLQHTSGVPRITTHKSLQHFEMPQFPN